MGAVITDFGITANELSVLGEGDFFMDCFIEAAENHRKERIEAKKNGARLWVAKVLDITAPDYDGYKFRFISETSP